MDRKPTRLFLVRHGETEWNTAQIFQGHLDSPLTPTGLRQAAQLASRLASEGIAAIYSSDQGRAMRTAQVAASRLGLIAAPRADLREIDCGDWTGQSYGDVRIRWPREFEGWRSRPHLHRMPGGEGVAQVQKRSLRFLAEIRQRHPGQAVCAVTHNTVVRTLVCHLQGWPLSRLWDGARQPNCAVNLIELQDGRADLLEIAGTDHLTSVSTIGFSV
ncbi:MAG: histidine phosphatase family protein [Chloroflexota bacterium]